MTMTMTMMTITMMTTMMMTMTMTMMMMSTMIMMTGGRNVGERPSELPAWVCRLRDHVRSGAPRLQPPGRLHPSELRNCHVRLNDDRPVWNARRSVDAGRRVRAKSERADRVRQRDRLDSRAALSGRGVGPPVRRGARSRQPAVGVLDPPELRKRRQRFRRHFRRRSSPEPAAPAHRPLREQPAGVHQRDWRTTRAACPVRSRRYGGHRQRRPSGSRHPRRWAFQPRVQHHRRSWLHQLRLSRSSTIRSRRFATQLADFVHCLFVGEHQLGLGHHCYPSYSGNVLRTGTYRATSVRRIQLRLHQRSLCICEPCRSLITTSG